MTSQEFNALPVEVRRFITAHAGCLGCGGNAAQKLTKAYGLYKAHKKMKAYQLHGGGINYLKDGQKGVLYPIDTNDTAEAIRKKIEIAKAIHAASPHVFTIFDEAAIAELLEGLEPAKVINLDKPFVKHQSPKRAGNGKFQKKEPTVDEDEI